QRLLPVRGPGQRPRAPRSRPPRPHTSALQLSALDLEGSEAMTDVVISSACRTPIGAFQGALSGLTAAELGAGAVTEAVKRAGIDGAKVERAFIGNVLPAGMGQAPARQAVIKAGLPVSVGAVTVNKVCGSGLQAVMFARRDILIGDVGVAI